MGKRIMLRKGLTTNAQAQNLNDLKRLSKGVYKSSSQGPK